MTEFKPTYLYIKKHKVTGLKYFGKTTGTEQFLLKKYKGGGTVWNRHLKKHGTEYVETIWYELFSDKDKLVEFALFFTEEADIVNSKLWANVKPEDGLMGGQKKGYLNGATPWNKGKKQSLDYISKRIKPQSEETKQRKSDSMKGKNRSPRSEEFKRKVSATMKGRPMSTITCPHCMKIGGVSQMKRWHFNNCKKGALRGL